MTNIGVTRRDLLALTGGVASTLVFPALAAAQEPKRGGTLVVGFPQPPRSLNAAVASGNVTAIPSTQLFASPLRYDDQWKPQPYLAESWDFASDAKSLKLNLRKNAVFHDGKPITSADVAFSIMAIKANHPFQTMMAPVEKVETPDAHTAIIRTSQPHPALLLAMSPALCPIMPKHIYDDGQDLKTHPRNVKDVVGSGPFKFVEFTPSQRFVAERFDQYFMPGGEPYLDRFVISFNPDSAALLLELQRGEVQILTFLTSPSDIKRLQANKDLVVTAKGYEGMGSEDWLEFNCAKKPWSDAKVRRAIATAIDKNFITKVLMDGITTSADGPIAPSSPFYTPESIVKYPFNLKKAATMLDEAGYKVQDGTRFSAIIDSGPSIAVNKMLAEYVRGQLRKLNIKAEYRASADFPSWAKRIGDHDFDMTIDSVFNWGDPTIGVARLYMSSNIKPLIWTNNASYSNPKVDELLEEAAQTANLVERKKFYAKFQQLITEDLPIDFLQVSAFHTAASKNVHHLPTSIWGVLSPFDRTYLSS